MTYSHITVEHKSNEMKLTPWFTGDQKPVRVGVYEREYGFKVSWYSYWNGKFWGTGSDVLENAAEKAWAGDPSALPNLPWRGVMK